MGDHEELKIFLSNCLIPSRFNEELRKKREYIVFKGDFCPKIAIVWSGGSVEVMATIARRFWPISWRNRGS